MRRKKKRGKNKVFTAILPKLAFLQSVCVCLCVNVVPSESLLFSEAHIIFGNDIKHKKSMKNAYLLFPCVPLFTFQDSQRAFFSFFLSLERAPAPLRSPRRTLGGTNEGGGGGAAVFSTAAGKCISFV